MQYPTEHKKEDGEIAAVRPVYKYNAYITNISMPKLRLVIGNNFIF